MIEKVDCKELWMFSVGSIFNEAHNRWIGYKSKIDDKQSILFSSPDGDTQKTVVDNLVSKSCVTLIIEQQIADQFLAK